MRSRGHAGLAEEAVGRLEQLQELCEAEKARAEAAGARAAEAEALLAATRREADAAAARSAEQARRCLGALVSAFSRPQAGWHQEGEQADSGAPSTSCAPGPALCPPPTPGHDVRLSSAAA